MFEKFEEARLYKLVVIALIEDKPQFLHLMEKNGLDLVNFLNDNEYFFLNKNVNIRIKSNLLIVSLNY